MAEQQGFQQGFEDHLLALERVVEQLEGGGLKLADQIERYQDGIERLKACHKLLADAEARVQKLVRDASGLLREEPMFDARSEQGQADDASARRPFWRPFWRGLRVTVEALLKGARTDVEAHLDRWLPTADVEPRTLHEAMRYAVFAGGKRLRPAIARTACLAVGGDAVAAMPAACALEMLHTYSLIHDDLPALDDDDLRRGRPTLHKRFDEATAILAGDALQTHAFEFLVLYVAEPVRAVGLVRELATAAGTQGMVGGEMADLEAEGGTPARARVDFIHERKTAALFRASAAMGGISGGADDRELEVLRAYGTALGLAFQVVDDILDETGDAATLGKSAGKDRVAQKMSYPAAVGLSASRERADHFSKKATDALRGLPENEATAQLAALAEFTITRIS